MFWAMLKSGLENDGRGKMDIGWLRPNDQSLNQSPLSRSCL